MIQSFGRRLRVAFDRASNEPIEEPGVPAVPLAPLVEFMAYGEDYVLSGRVRLAAERLSDMLNGHDEYELVDVMVERLDEGTAYEVAEIVVHRDELLLVHATGPRGSQARRRRTRPHALAMQLGPYHVRGYLHALPGTDPLIAIRRYAIMVPLTEASITFTAGGLNQRRDVGTVVLNRELIDWVAPALEQEVAMPDLPLETQTGPLLKDFTGNIFAEGREPIRR